MNVDWMHCNFKTLVIIIGLVPVEEFVREVRARTQITAEQRTFQLYNFANAIR